MYHLISPAWPPKPETVVIAECDGIRERMEGETVHHRENDDDRLCSKCGKPANVWLASEDRWKEHSTKCQR